MSVNGISAVKLSDIMFGENANLIMAHKIPDSVTNIGKCAFSYCISFTSIMIPDGITSIGASTFDWHSQLTSITIPSNVISIGEGAFYDCSSLTNIIFEGTIDQWNTIEKGSGWCSYISGCSICCTDGMKYSSKQPLKMRILNRKIIKY